MRIPAPGSDNPWLIGAALNRADLYSDEARFSGGFNHTLRQFNWTIFLTKMPACGQHGMGHIGSSLYPPGKRFTKSTCDGIIFTEQRQERIVIGR